MSHTKQLFTSCACVILCLFISCGKTEDTSKQATLKKIIDQNLGKELLLPKDLKLYTPFSNYLADSAQIAKADLKIYTHVNTSCSTCVENMTKWNTVATNFSKYNVPVIIVCTSKDDFELIKFLCETEEIKSFPYPFFFDAQKDYVDNNPFMRQHSHLETILTDKNNNILVMGNPTYTENIYNVYKDEIQKRHKNKPILVTGKLRGTD